MSPTARWNAFWFERGSPEALAAFRILFAICLAAEIPSSLLRSRQAVYGGFHLAYLDWIPLMSPQLHLGLHLGQLPLLALLGIGLLPRLACGGLVFLQGWIFFADQLHFRNHPYFFLLILLLLMISPCGEALSPKRFRRRIDDDLPPLLTAQRLIQSLVCLSYFFAGLQKINLPFVQGVVMSGIFERTVATGTSGNLLRALGGEPLALAATEWVGVPGNMIPISVFTIAVELGLCIGLWLPRTRLPSIAVGAAFHLGIGLVMDIWTFTGAMLASYLLFLPEPLARRRPEAPR